MFSLSAEVLWVAPELCQGNEQYEDINHIRVIQTQAFQEGVDSGDPAKGQSGDTAASSCLKPQDSSPVCAGVLTPGISEELPCCDFASGGQHETTTLMTGSRVGWFQLRRQLCLQLRLKGTQRDWHFDQVDTSQGTDTSQGSCA